MAEDGNKKPSVRKLTVNNFSVIKHAELEFGKITVLIGPQASGKSLLCKLAFFLGREVLETAANSVMSAYSLPGLKRVLATQFVQRFSSHSGLGEKASAKLSAGSYSVAFSWDDHPGNEEVFIEFAEEFERLYLQLAASRAHRVLTDVASQRELQTDVFISLGRLLANGDMYDTLFIPSDRSLLTSATKGFTLAQSPGIDSLVSRFGAEIAWGGKWRIGSVNAGDDALFELNQDMVRIAGGSVHANGNEPMFKGSDSRMIPLPLLSSGTQELLPLINVLERYATQQEHRQVHFQSTIEPARVKSAIGVRVLIYLEEPEANIFPSTQSELVQLFAWLSSRPYWDFSWVITTHSPYVLTAFNDLIKAGQAVAQRPDRASEVESIIPKKYWIPADDFAAYAFDGKDGILRSIMDKETKLIDGDVLDDISSTIGEKFEQLLEIQYGGK